MRYRHRLKTWPAYFDAVQRGVKTFEVRPDDRGFRAGDCVVLLRYDPATDEISGEAEFVITYVLPGAQFGIEPGYVVFGLAGEDKSACICCVDNECECGGTRLGPG